MHVVAIGVDSETIHGKPFTFQFFSKDIKLERIIWLRKPANATRDFFAFCDSLPATRDRHYVFFGHNLAFDLVSFFYDRHHRLREEKISEKWHGWNVEIVYAAVRFATFKKSHKQITVIDTGAYFSSPPRSLAQLAEIFCPDLPKLAMPKDLGNKRFTAKDAHFCAYAMRDSEIAYYLGLFLLAQHREWDVSLSVSGPHFSSKVFRRHFLKHTIPLPPRKMIYASLTSYHGGKNNITVSAGLYRGVHGLDIKSAYPYAMSQFPSFSNPKLYKSIRGGGHPNILLPFFGVYRITGNAKKCKWPALFNHGFKPLQGDFSGVWVTGFELNEALRAREVRIDYLEGYFYDAERDKLPSPFKAYVEEFYARKESAKDKPQREFNKLLMNSLYGKFIQTRAAPGFSDIVFDMDEKSLLENHNIIAGGLFNPFIATLITGHCRAYIHQLEHKYAAIHTSTDGIQTQRKPTEKPGLGGLSVEFSGDSLILRNKLYIIYRRTTTQDKADARAGKRVLFSEYRKGFTIAKYALHGFHADVRTLEHLWNKGIREYEYVKVNKLRESLRRKLAVNDFVTTKATLTLPGEARQSKRKSTKPEKE